MFDFYLQNSKIMLFLSFIDMVLESVCVRWLDHYFYQPLLPGRNDRYVWMTCEF